MTDVERTVPAIAFDSLRLCYGSWLALDPGRAATVAGDERPSDAMLRVVRLLGWRHVLQALVSPRHRGSSEFALGAVVDALHSATAGGVALLDVRARRILLNDAAIAGGFAVVGAVAARVDGSPVG